MIADYTLQYFTSKLFETFVVGKYSSFYRIPIENYYIKIPKYQNIKSITKTISIFSAKYHNMNDGLMIYSLHQNNVVYKQSKFI